MSKRGLLIKSIPGYVSHELQHCIENPQRYLLLAYWQTVEAHTICFRQSAQYQEWKRLLHHFYDLFPTVELRTKTFILGFRCHHMVSMMYLPVLQASSLV